MITNLRVGLEAGRARSVLMIELREVWLRTVVVWREEIRSIVTQIEELISSCLWSWQWPYDQVLANTCPWGLLKSSGCEGKFGIWTLKSPLKKEACFASPGFCLELKYDGRSSCSHLRPWRWVERKLDPWKLCRVFIPALAINVQTFYVRRK